VINNNNETSLRMQKLHID